MYRARFRVIGDDCRPMAWPIRHPYWVTGYGDDHGVLIAYVDDEKELLSLWPDAEQIELGDPVTEYQFGDRFPMPAWFAPAH